MKTIIVDDERLARNELKRLLEDFPKINVVAEAANADEAIELINEHNPDLLFFGYPNAREEWFRAFGNHRG